MTKKMNTNPENENASGSSEAVDGLFAEMESNPDVDGPAQNTPITQPIDEVARLKMQLEDAEKQTLLAQADMENFRRRTRRDTQEQLKYASLPLLAGLLDVLDNLQRAIEAQGAAAPGDGLLAGVELVEQQISSLLENNGCKKIESIGHPFDPNLHQAVQMQASDEYGPNIVMQELRTGYQLHERVVRPSQVFVSTGPFTEDK